MRQPAAANTRTFFFFIFIITIYNVLTLERGPELCRKRPIYQAAFRLERLAPAKNINKLMIYAQYVMARLCAGGWGSVVANAVCVLLSVFAKPLQKVISQSKGYLLIAHPANTMAILRVAGNDARAASKWCSTKIALRRNAFLSPFKTNEYERHVKWERE